MNSRTRNPFARSVKSYRQAALVQRKVAARCCSLVPGKKFPRVLEIGAGGGLLTGFCLERLQNIDLYVALDVSREMLSLVPGGKAVLIQADGEEAPFRSKTFDLILSSSAMQWYSRGLTSIPKNLNLLKKGGFFSLAYFVRGTFREMERISSMTGFGSLHLMARAREHVQAFQDRGLRPQWEIIEHTLRFKSVSDFLKSHKQTGATYTSSGARFGKKAYHDFCRTYEKIYGDRQGIPVSYRVLHLWGSR